MKYDRLICVFSLSTVLWSIKDFSHNVTNIFLNFQWISTSKPTFVSSIVCIHIYRSLNLFCFFSCRSELMTQAACVRQSWLSSLALVGQGRSLIKEQLGQWRVYRRGLKVLWKLLSDVDPLLPPAGPAMCALHQQWSCRDDYQVRSVLCSYSCVSDSYTNGQIVVEMLCRVKFRKITSTDSPHIFQSALKMLWVSTPRCTHRHWMLEDIYVKLWQSQSVRADCSQSSRLYRKPGNEPAHCWRRDENWSPQLFR